MNNRSIRTIVLTTVWVFSASCGSPQQPEAAPRVVLSAQAAEGMAALGLEVPAIGRVFVIVSRSDEEEPRLGTGVTGNPLWGVDVRDFAAGDSAVLAADDDSFMGYPLPAFGDLPPGDYRVQAFMACAFVRGTNECLVVKRCRCFGHGIVLQ